MGRCRDKEGVSQTTLQPKSITSTKEKNHRRKLYIPVSSCQGCSSLQGTAFEHCSALSHAEPAQRKLFPQIQLELRLPAQHSQHCSLFSGTLPLTAEAASKSQGRKIFNGRVPWYHELAKGKVQTVVKVLPLFKRFQRVTWNCLSLLEECNSLSGNNLRMGFFMYQQTVHLSVLASLSSHRYGGTSSVFWTARRTCFSLSVMQSLPTV